MDKDIIVLPGMRNHPLDPSELPEYNPGSIRFRGMSAKTIFDGTVPFDMKEHFVRAKFQEVEDNVFISLETSVESPNYIVHVENINIFID